MANLLKDVGLVRNVTEASGNLTLRISVFSYTEYTFSQTFNVVGYTGVTLTFGSNPISLEFADSWSYEKIAIQASISRKNKRSTSLKRLRKRLLVYNYT
jgi:hypothetical protein